jgi:glutamate-5-semialdehyde dehydrogenase
MTIIQLAEAVKESSFALAATSEDLRNQALENLVQYLELEKTKIFEANQKDLSLGKENQLSGPLLNRLKFDEHKLREVSEGIRGLIEMEDPLHRILLERQLDQELLLKKITCPIGVIGVIFESRPDALVQISALCIKSGNGVVLKGGSEAAHTNRALFNTIEKAGQDAGLPAHFALLVETREDTREMLKWENLMDLIIPRGSNEFVRFIQDNSRIPVMGHADGICHIYVDENANLEKALPIIWDSKTQYVAACNTVETLLVHHKIAPTLLPLLAKKMEGQVQLRGCRETKNIIPVQDASQEDHQTEYLDYILSVKVVHSLEEAIKHINRYGSHHTDCIVTEDSQAKDFFFSLVDSAGVYQNCSTRFADGYRYGFGAEVGISTGKLHARGPVGLEGLVTYKYQLTGNGHVVSDYAQGKKAFHFQNL